MKTFMKLALAVIVGLTSTASLAHAKKHSKKKNAEKVETVTESKSGQ